LLVISQPLGRFSAIFLEVDYIISQTNQDLVEDWQDKLRNFWKQIPPVKLTYNSAREEVQSSASFSQFASTMFSVLFTSVLLVKPHQADWYNYRLDRIQKMTWSGQIQVSPTPPTALPAGSSALPRRHRSQMAKAWGFDFHHLY